MTAIQTASTETPIINFANKVRPPAEADNLLSHPDAALIVKAVRGAASLAGSNGAFHVDPTDDNDFAQAIDEQLLAKGRAAVNFAAAYAPTTLDGLRCKSDLLGIALDHLDGSDLKPLQRSLIGDIARFQRSGFVLTDAKIAP